MKLTNTAGDRLIVKKLLDNGYIPKVIVGLGCFTNELASSLSSIPYEGTITDIDMVTGSCKWNFIDGNEMIPVNINCMELL